MKLKNELIRGGIILFIFFNLINLMNFLFQFFMVRMLTVEDYGIFSALMAIILIFAIPSEAIQLISSKYTSLFLKNKELGKIKGLFSKMMSKSVVISILVFLVFAPTAIFLSWFLKIPVGLILLAGVMIFFIFLIPIIRGILQGQKKFWKMSLSSFVEIAITIGIGIGLVYLGLSVYGAILGVVLGLILAFIFSFVLISDILSVEKEQVKIENGYSYSFSVFFILAIIFTMFSLDILLAKRFFSPEVAGIYAVASLSGKILFYATSPISRAMFPITSGVREKESKKTLLNSMLIVSFLGLIGVISFFFIPHFIINLLFGGKYLAVTPILWIVGSAFLFLSLANLIAFYLLSLKKIKNKWLFLVFPLVQILLLSLFHENLVEFSIALISSFIFLFLGMVVMTKNGKD